MFNMCYSDVSLMLCGSVGAAGGSVCVQCVSVFRGWCRHHFLCRLSSGVLGAISPLPPDITGVCCQLSAALDAGALDPAARRTADTTSGVRVAHGVAQQKAPTTHLIDRVTPAAVEEQRERASEKRCRETTVRWASRTSAPRELAVPRARGDRLNMFLC